MQGFTGNIEQLTRDNNFFRKVLFTGTHQQLVVMSLAPGEDIGMEVHGHVDQFFRFEIGEGKVVMNGVETVVTDGSAVIVTAGTEHNIINTSTTQALKLYTIYSPPNHPDQTVHETRTIAMAHEDHK